jgi:transcriptional regulator with XRE-family HTH domain
MEPVHDLDNDKVMLVNDPAGEVIWELSPYIGEVLWGLRIGRRLTQDQLASLMAAELKDEKVDQSYISRVERGETISLKRLSLWCYVLGFKTSEVVTLAEDAAVLERKTREDQVNYIEQRIDKLLATK